MTSIYMEYYEYIIVLKLIRVTRIKAKCGNILEVS